MTIIGADEIYAAARAAGFSPDQAVTMTAIALAESGGDTGAHNPSNEDSRGLWQINMEAHAGSDWAQGIDLYDPYQNAVAAWHVSEGGADIGPWTVTHQDREAPYTKHAEAARAAATAAGEPAMGNFVGPQNYESADVAAGAAGGPPPAPAASVPEDSSSLAAGEFSVHRFLEVARAQVGDEYVKNAHTEPTDPDPDAFDCSELVEWAAAQAGVQGVGESSYEQYLDMKAAGTTMTVEEALATPGALLFKFPHEPIPNEGRQDGSHVAISLGDGTVLEAASPKHGVRIAEAGDRFGYAARIPGLDYSGTAAGGADPVVDTGKPVEAPPLLRPEPNPLEVASARAGEGDSDRDALADFWEITYGLDPAQPDTDGDGITDGYELIVLGTRADRADTDFDQMADGLEIALGLDPLVADNPDLGVPLLIPEAMHVDSDGDGLSDWGEELGGTDPGNPDTDSDGVFDAEELLLGGANGPADA